MTAFFFTALFLNTHIPHHDTHKDIHKHTQRRDHVFMHTLSYILYIKEHSYTLKSQTDAVFFGADIDVDIGE